MGIFDRIKSAIWGEDEKPAAPTTTAAPQQPRTASTASVPGGASPAPAPAPQTTAQNAPAPAPAQPAPAPAAPATKASDVDVAAILEKAAAGRGQKLDWRHSIVDLMKALDLDSSLAARKELATELNYTGDTNDSAAMNTWLHKALMRKLAENGGRVPADLTD
ncbi:MAG: hypothetical protein DI629_05940 [Mesorhizobium amorphae]|nr:MAG: hypothetical protein DI629_05940 [Mesorhizobium amorphae]